MQYLLVYVKQVSSNQSYIFSFEKSVIRETKGFEKNHSSNHNTPFLTHLKYIYIYSALFISRYVLNILQNEVSIVNVCLMRILYHLSNQTSF